jgi:hypothetical protein
LVISAKNTAYGQLVRNRPFKGRNTSISYSGIGLNPSHSVFVSSVQSGAVRAAGDRGARLTASLWIAARARRDGQQRCGAGEAGVHATGDVGTEGE